MRNFLLVLLVTLLPVWAFGQRSNELILKDEASVKSLADSLALNAKRTFKFKNAGISKLDPYYYFVRYEEETTSNKKEELVVVFKKNMIGANTSLEIGGTPEYVFYSVEGNFLDLYPFWKKYLASDADAEQIINNNFEKGFKDVIINNTEYRFRLSKANTENKWSITRFVKQKTSVKK